METQHPIDIRIWVKAPDRETAVRKAHDKLCDWFTQPTQLVDGYGYPDGTLLLYKVLDENGECKARPSDPEPDPVVVPDPPQVRFRSDGEKLLDFICESCHEWKNADELSENPHTTAWVCKSCGLPKPLPVAPQGEGNGFDDIDTTPHK